MLKARDISLDAQRSLREPQQDQPNCFISCYNLRQVHTLQDEDSPVHPRSMLWECMRSPVPGSCCLQGRFPGPRLTQHTLNSGILSSVSTEACCPCMAVSISKCAPPPPAGIPTSGLPRLHKLYIVSINPTAPFFLSRCKGVGNSFPGEVWPAHGVAVGPRVGSNEVITAL